MVAHTNCSSCGGVIEIGTDSATQIIARGDRFYHQGCIDVHVEKYSSGVPAFRVPRSW